MANLAHLLMPEIPILEKIVRSAVIYIFVLIAFRFSGKRQVGQLTPFDLVVLLIIANVVQNAIIGPDNSISGAIIGAVTILGLNYLFVRITYYSPRMRHILEPNPSLLIYKGHVIHKHLQRELITMDDLDAALRKNGVLDPKDVQFAVLEDTGTISVIPRNHS
ncbi:MAG: DUF421 domain-containing protein [Deltaproteobacteria bacterium CG11_big_fil_rev_8_21_14_0_20_47_16]|nr:MAG: DUF421 domain-containing protein [Deltaproteobacteria bacterium CG11_big_fil_rev_8_21_14_0_20_47_16]